MDLAPTPYCGSGGRRSGDLQVPDLVSYRIADSATKTVGDLGILFRSLRAQRKFRRYGGATHAQAQGEERKLTQALLGKTCPIWGHDPGRPVLVGRLCRRIAAGRAGTTQPRPAKLGGSHGASPKDVSW